MQILNGLGDPRLSMQIYNGRDASGVWEFGDFGWLMKFMGYSY